MVEENSGKVYRIKLKHDKGYVYSLIRDYSDISDFDGILVQVYTFLDKEKKQDINIEKIIESGIMLGPMPINKYPSKNGKYAWELVGHSDSYDKESPFFKNLRGLIVKNYNWNKLSPWYKFKKFEENYTNIPVEYSEVRSLETTVLNHPEMIVIKATMIKIIEEGNEVSDFYDLSELGNLNVYLQIVNTYFPLSRVIELLSPLEPNPNQDQ